MVAVTIHFNDRINIAVVRQPRTETSLDIRQTALSVVQQFCNQPNGSKDYVRQL